MTKKFTTQIVGHEVAESIYVKADGRTVCDEKDKDVAQMKYAKGDRLTEAQVAGLIFPRAGAEPVPDAAARAADTIPDADTRAGGKRK